MKFHNSVNEALTDYAVRFAKKHNKQIPKMNGDIATTLVEIAKMISSTVLDNGAVESFEPKHYNSISESVTNILAVTDKLVEKAETPSGTTTILDVGDQDRIYVQGTTLFIEEGE